MRPIGKITAPECEVLVFALTTEEHDLLHAGPKNFVNTKNLFGKPVREVALHPNPHPNEPTPEPNATTSTETWLTIIAHRPGCICAATCTNLP